MSNRGWAAPVPGLFMPARIGTLHEEAGWYVYAHMGPRSGGTRRGSDAGREWAGRSRELRAGGGHRPAAVVGVSLEAVAAGRDRLDVRLDGCRPDHVRAAGTGRGVE